MVFNENALIARLEATDRTRLLDVCERVSLSREQRLIQPDDSFGHVYFSVNGFACLLAHEPDSTELIVAMVGREGMLDPRAALGIANTPVRAVVQSEGWAWRISTEIFQRQLKASAALKRLMDRYVAVVLNQFAALALCLHHHEVGARLARWLLMSQDRSGSSHCQVTQEALSAMLGVRRVSITTAANVLQRHGAIRYHRGDIHLLDRAMLERAACSCYHADRRCYQDLLR